jgi:hypothetical protein
MLQNSTLVPDNVMQETGIWLLTIASSTNTPLSTGLFPDDLMKDRQKENANLCSAPGDKKLPSPNFKQMNFLKTSLQ